jgi:hypothetical protein
MKETDYRIEKIGNYERWYDKKTNDLRKKIEYWTNGSKYFEAYYLNDNRHREDGPAYQTWDENGFKQYEEYWLDGKKHREDGPAYQSWNKNGTKQYEIYYINGKYHREDGPTYQRWDENGDKKYEEYYLNGKRCPKEKYDKIIQKEKWKLI